MFHRQNKNLAIKIIAVAVKLLIPFSSRASSALESLAAGAQKLSGKPANLRKVLKR